MKKVVLIIIALVAFENSQGQNALNGEKLFKTSCSVCHTVGKGKSVGPDLIKVTSRRNEKWLVSWIKSSQKMVKANDPVAVKVFNENNKQVMPDANLTDEQIKDVLSYIKNLSVPAAKPAVKTSTGTPPPKTPAKKVAGQNPDIDKNWVNADHQVKSVKSNQPLDAKNLKAEIWTKAPVTKVALVAQNITYPNLNDISLDTILLRSAYFNNELFFLAEWKDASKNTEVDADKFCDQLAIELPLSAANIPSYMMGNKDGMVHIVHWKAIWQEDCEKGFQDVQLKYPNMWVDIYPGLEGHLDRSKRIYSKDITAEHIIETRAYANMPGTYSGNPISQIKRKEPVEEASAEGFGTLSTQETQQAKGWAEWKDGKWTVCMGVPVNTGNKYKATITNKTKIAFALWDGGHQNIGGRKHFIPWIDLLIEK